MISSVKKIALTACFVGAQTAASAQDYGTHRSFEIDSSTHYADTARNAFRETVIRQIGKDEFLHLQRLNIKTFNRVEGKAYVGEKAAYSRIIAAEKAIATNGPAGVRETRIVKATYTDLQPLDGKKEETIPHPFSINTYTIEYSVPRQQGVFFIKTFEGIDSASHFKIKVEESLQDREANFLVEPVVFEAFQQNVDGALLKFEKERFKDVFDKTAENIFGKFFALPIVLAYPGLPVSPPQPLP